MGLLKGLVLNAGAGQRDFSHLVEGELINQDIAWAHESRTHIHIYSPLERIPVSDCHFDTVVCIAVLEHVAEPDAAVREMFRVLKPGGYVVASVPFLQPEHKVPTDYQRYTRDGLERLFVTKGFEIDRIYPLFTIFHTLHWIAYEAIEEIGGRLKKILRYVILPPLALAARKSTRSSDKLASAFQCIARKPLAPSTDESA
jgi:SAM-dependent methyltransferase